MLQTRAKTRLCTNIFILRTLVSGRFCLSIQIADGISMAHKRIDRTIKLKVFLVEVHIPQTESLRPYN